MEALRWMMGNENDPSPSVDPPEMLLRWGLMARQVERDMALYSVHTLVREFVGQKAEAQKVEKKRLLVRAAQYYEMKGKVSKSLWDYLNARQYYFQAEEWDSADNIVQGIVEYLEQRGHVELAMNLLMNLLRPFQECVKQ